LAHDTLVAILDLIIEMIQEVPPEAHAGIQQPMCLIDPCPGKLD